MKEIHLLFTGIGRRIELIQAFRDAALVLDKNLKIFGADMAGTAPALSYCDYTRKVVSMKDPEYIDNLLSICKQDKIDLLIPTIDTDLLILAENKQKFIDAGAKVMISEPEMIRICRDKNNTSHFFIDCGLKAPLTVNDWKEYRGGYPAFIKPKDGSSSINAFKVDNVSELEIYANQIEDYIIQPFVSGKEYTIDIFCNWNGEPISIVPRERLQIRAGEVLKTQICMDKLMIEEARSLCKSFRPCGPMTVQLIRDKEQIDWFIEINPRFGGGAPLSMKAGAKTAEATLKMLEEGHIDCDYVIADEAVYSRFDQSVCVKEGKHRIKGIIFDLDDTLYSEKEYIKSGFKAVSEYLDGDYYDRLWKFFESGKPPIDALLAELDISINKNEVLNVYRNHKPVIHLYSGIKEMLMELHKKNIKVGIITDGRPEGQNNKIEALELKMLVDDIIITDELGGIQFRKPCDIAYRILQTKWKLNKNEIVCIGDNDLKDFQAPRQLGMDYICVNNGEGLYKNNSSIDTIASIKRLLKQLDMEVIK